MEKIQYFYFLLQILLTIEGLCLPDLVKENILRLVVLDEYHFLVEYGNGFCSEFNRIPRNMFDVFFKQELTMLLLLMSTSNNLDTIMDVQRILRFKIKVDDLYWFSPHHYLKHNIKFNIMSNVVGHKIFSVKDSKICLLDIVESS